MFYFFLMLILLGPPNLLLTSQQLPTNIFILAGQSNMAGRGGVVNDTKSGNLTWDGIVPPQCQPNPSIFRLSAKLEWVLAQEPLDADIDYNKTNGVGPGMAFANAVLTQDPTIGVLGLVPCAIGGTNITQWAKGGFLYDQLLRRSREALKSGGALRAMLWYQGESDTILKEDADGYKGRLKMFFKEIRADLDHPFLPIIQVGLASGEGAFVEKIREAQLGLKLGNVKCVDAKGMPLEADGLHLTTPAQVHVGQLLADAFLHPQSTPIRTTTVSLSTRHSIFTSQYLTALSALIFYSICLSYGWR